jgi:hypothetical protein
MIEETGEVMVQPSSREPWTPIEEFMNEGEKRDDKQIYFIRTIKLLSNLCLVRTIDTSAPPPSFGGLGACTG